MSCRLCFRDDIELFNIFDDEGRRLKVADIVSKYLWFEIYEDDPISSCICHTCWYHLSDFHTFYLDLEQKQSVMLKEEKCEAFLIELSEHQETETNIKAEPEEPVTKEEHDKDDSKANFSNNRNVVEIDRKTRSGRTKPSQKVKRKPIRKWITIDEDIDDFVPSPKPRVEESDYEIDSEDENMDSDDSLRSSKKQRSGDCSTVKRTPVINDRHIEVDAALKNFCSMFCDKCEEEFPEHSWSGVLKHYTEKHQIPGYVFCCNRKFDKKLKIYLHISKHINPNAFKCALCNKTCAYKANLEKHMEIHKPPESRPFACDQCPRRFGKKYLLDKHMVNTHSKLKFPCLQCEKVLSSQISLRGHISNIHENRFVQICEICAKSFRNKTNYDNHKKVMHAEQPTPKLQCTICKAWAKNESSLRCHMHRHANEGAHECEICGKISPNKAALRSHKRYVHLLERKYSCTFCDKAFKVPVELREHMAGHTGEILYHCPVPGCPKSCNSNANMMAHKKKFHREFWEEEQRQKAL